MPLTDLYSTIAHSPWLIAGGGMLAGSAWSRLREAPGKAAIFLMDKFTMSVEIENNQDLFGWVGAWLDKQPYTQKARFLRAETRYRNRVQPLGSSEAENYDIILTPAPGNHFFRYQKSVVWMSRVKEKNEHYREERITLRIPGRDQRLMRSLLQEIREHAVSVMAVQPENFIARLDQWEKIEHRYDRPLDSVIMPDGVTERLIQDIERFLSEREWYFSMGIPWRRGIMLDGLRGTGKTSLISALAGYLGLNLYYLNIGSPMMNDDTLMKLLSSIRPRSIVLLEDVDVAFGNREAQQQTKAGEKKGSLTFSGLLNCLDGVIAAEGRIVVMTTNHVENIDPALIRPGRVDLRIPFTYADEDQIARMYRRFFPATDDSGVADFLMDVQGLRITTAELQELFVCTRDDVDGHLETLKWIEAKRKKEHQPIA